MKLHSSAGGRKGTSLPPRASGSNRYPCCTPLPRLPVPRWGGRSSNAQWFCNPNIDLYLRPGVPSQESTQVLLDPPIQDDNYRSICCAFDPAHKFVVFGVARGCSLLHASLCLARRVVWASVWQLPLRVVCECVQEPTATGRSYLAPSHLSRDVTLSANTPMGQLMW